MATPVTERAQDVADHLRERDWPETLGRIGLVARGVIYLCVALVAFQIAFGDHGKEADRNGALEAVSHQPLGEVLLFLLAGGFLAYATWRLVKAITGASEGRDDEDDTKRAGRRVLDLGRALVYIGMFGSTVRVLIRDEAGSSNDQQAKSFSAELMSSTPGRWLVIAIGLGLLGAGVMLFIRAMEQKFEEHLDRPQLSSWQRTWLPRLGMAGYGARGVIAALVCIFVAQAGITFDPNKAEGISGALQRLVKQPFGPAMLAAVALGLIAFGAYSFVEARYRKVLDD